MNSTEKSNNVHQAGYVVLFGDRTDGRQKIDVKWDRVVDDEELSTSYLIQVEPSSEGE